MIGLQTVKLVPVTPPGAKVDAGSFTTATIDTLGFKFLSVICLLGDTDIAMSVLKLQESDNSGMSSPSDVAAYGTDAKLGGGTSVLPTAGNDNKPFGFQVDLRGRKRYFDVVATAGDGSTGTYMTVLALLSEGDESPTTAAEQGFEQIIRK